MLLMSLYHSPLLLLLLKLQLSLNLIQHQHHQTIQSYLIITEAVDYH